MFGEIELRLLRDQTETVKATSTHVVCRSTTGPRTSSAEPAISDDERAAVIPAVRQPYLGDRQGTSGHFRRNFELDATERREVLRVNARKDISDVDTHVCGEVRGRGKRDIGDVSRRALRACGV